MMVPVTYTDLSNISNEKLAAAFDRLTDEWCEMFGVDNCIRMLIDCGWQALDLIRTGFDADDVDRVIAEDAAETGGNS